MSALKRNLKERVEASEAQILHQPQKRTVEETPTETSRKRYIGGHFSEAVYRQMKYLTIEKDMTMQELLTDGINALFCMHEKPPIAGKEES